MLKNLKYFTMILLIAVVSILSSCAKREIAKEVAPSDFLNIRVYAIDVNARAKM